MISLVMQHSRRRNQGFGNFDFGSSFSDIFEDFLEMMYLEAAEDLAEELSNRGNDLRYDVTISMEKHTPA